MSHPRDLLTQNHNPYTKADHLNPEGFPSFTHSLEKRYLQMLLTNTLGGTFYAKQHDLVRDALDLHLEMTTENPQQVAELIVFAREQGLMRLQPIIGLAFLSAVDYDLFHQVFNSVILTPGDLEDFVVVLRGGTIPAGLTRRVKRVINQWLNTLSEYHALKYAKALKFVMRHTHPNPITDKHAAIFAWINNRKRWKQHTDHTLTPQIDTYETLKVAIEIKNRDLIAKLLQDGKLPYELVTGLMQPSSIQWRIISRHMPYMALLRHLNTLHRHDALRLQRAYIAERLSDVRAMRKAKILPFRLLRAYQEFMMPENEKIIRGALEFAMNEACENLPKIHGKICIAPDVSGSMDGRISQMGTTRYIDIAAVFASSLLKQSSDALVLPFNHRVLTFDLDHTASVITYANAITKLLSGGTTISAPIQYLLDNNIVVDTFIGITDNVEWTGGFRWSGETNEGFLPVWNAYKAQVAPHAKAFLITIAPYRSQVAPENTPDVYFIYGWSEQVVRYIALMQAG